MGAEDRVGELPARPRGEGVPRMLHASKLVARAAGVLHHTHFNQLCLVSKGSGDASMMRCDSVAFTIVPESGCAAAGKHVHAQLAFQHLLAAVLH